MPHLNFELLEPPVGSNSDQLREIPYQVVPANSNPSTASDSNEKADAVLLENANRKRHHLYKNGAKSVPL